MSLNSSWSTRLILGTVYGLIAVLLMFNGIQIDVARVGLRIIPVAIAMLFGGFPSAIAAGIMITRTRYFLTPVDQMEGFYLSTLIIVLIITPIGIVRRFVHVSTRYFQLLVSIGVLYSLPAIYILTNSWSTFFKISIAYIFFNL
jgi:diguanylate cyclase